MHNICECFDGSNSSFDCAYAQGFFVTVVSLRFTVVSFSSYSSSTIPLNYSGKRSPFPFYILCLSILLFTYSAALK